MGAKEELRTPISFHGQIQDIEWLSQKGYTNMSSSAIWVQLTIRWVGRFGEEQGILPPVPYDPEKMVIGRWIQLEPLRFLDGYSRVREALKI